jgi:heptosyltransferase-2
MSKGALLVRLHSLGDVVLASGTAASMALSGPVSFATRPEYEPVVRRIPGGITPVPVSDNWLDIRKISGGYSEIVDLQNNLATKLAFAGKNARRFRFSRRQRRKILLGSDSTLPFRAEEYLRTWGGKGNADSVLTRLETPPEGVFNVGIVAGGRWPMKSIPAGVVEELARLFCDVAEASVFVFGGGGDQNEINLIVEHCGYRNVTALTAEGGISQLISRIEKLHLLVSPDSGPAHLAKALGVPLQVIFTSTSKALGFWPEDFTGAFKVEGIPCRPCHRHGGRKCSAGDEQCRKMLVPREIFEAAICLLK